MKALWLILFATLLVSISSSVLPTWYEHRHDPDPDCETATVLGSNYKVHPYRDINLGRNLTIENFFNQTLGEKSQYEIKKSVGKGTFSKVFKAVHIPTGQRVAIKSLVHTKEDKASKEIKLLKDLKDAPNFLPLRDILKNVDEQGETQLDLVFDYFSTGDWKVYLLNVTRYQMKKMIYETLRTLEYAHSRGIMHRDIKPLNVLMRPSELLVRVIDWGHSDYYLPNKSYSVRVGTIHYKSPDLILNYTMHDYSVDVWATGVMLGEIAFKRIHLFEDDDIEESATDSSISKEALRTRNHRRQLNRIARVLGTEKLREYAFQFGDSMLLDYLGYVGDFPRMPFTQWINEDNAHMIEPSLIDLLDRMLVYDHRTRITAKEALAHSYFDEVRNK